MEAQFDFENMSAFAPLTFEELQAAVEQYFVEYYDVHGTAVKKAFQPFLSKTDDAVRLTAVATIPADKITFHSIYMGFSGLVNCLEANDIVVDDIGRFSLDAVKIEFNVTVKHTDE